MGILFILSPQLNKIQADTVTVHATNFVSSFSVSNIANCYDGDISTYCTVSSSNQVDGRFNFNPSIPSGSVIENYEITIYAQNSFSKAGCTIYVQLVDNPPTVAFDIPSYSSSGGTYTTWYYNVSATTNATVWSSSLWDNQDPSSALWAIYLGGGSCTTPTSRQYNEAILTLTYTPPDATNTDIVDSILNLPGAIVDGIQSLFIPDSAFLTSQFEDTIELVQSKAPFSYAYSAMDLNFGEVATLSSTLTIDWPFYQDGEDIVSESVSFDSNTNLILGNIKNVVSAGLWFGFVLYVVHKMRHVI